MNQDAMVRLQQVFAEHPELAERVQSATGVADVAERLVAIGAEYGIAIDTPALTAELEQAQRSTAESGQLSDDQLAEAVGGGSLAVVASIASLGLSCAVVSILVAESRDSRGCKGFLDGMKWAMFDQGD